MIHANDDRGTQVMTHRAYVRVYESFAIGAASFFCLVFVLFYIRVRALSDLIFTPPSLPQLHRGSDLVLQLSL
jgi:hypothetical protein